MIKYIVFDFDGTIADTFHEIKQIVKKEFDMSDKFFDLLKKEGVWKVIKKSDIPIRKLPEFVYVILSKLRNKKDIKLFPGMIALFGKLKKKYKIGIVSSNSEENISDVLKKHGIEGFFDFVYSDSSIFGKHLVLKKMCKKYKINPKEIIYVGDEDRDIIAARKVGIKVVAVTWGFNSEERLIDEKPDYLVRKPREIIKKVF